MADSAQLALPDLPGIGQGWELLLPAPERARRCTASTAVKLAEQREAIIAALATLGTRRVAEAFGVSREVVRVIRAEAIRDGKLDQLKEELGRRALSVADAVLDRIADEVDDLPRASLAVTYGILKDKGLLLTGQPTARVEHTVTHTHADLNDFIASLPAATPVSEGGNCAQKTPALDLAEIGIATVRPAPESASCSGDNKSPVSAHNTGEAGLNSSELGQNQPEKEGR